MQRSRIKLPWIDSISGSSTSTSLKAATTVPESDLDGTILSFGFLQDQNINFLDRP